ncbi:hypothetical protein EsDP_00002483 [Epichloe bromicola]|uniref:Dicer-like protein 1 n=1 Tax=Epichloe bromicola TaxID=79588 RepID=A0ABQ0CKX2_9HYPO
MASTPTICPSSHDMSSIETDTDSDDGIERYLQTSNAAPQAREKPPNAEDVAFQTWVANQTHETSSDSNEPVEADNKSLRLKNLGVSDDTRRIINSPRQYQLDLFERAKESNTIIVLDTGSGKTLIAALLLRHTLDGELERRAEGLPNRTAFFLVDKVVLCLQQYNVLSANLDHPVGKFHGNTITGLKTKEDWDGHVRDNMVIVCTAQILLDLLGSGLISMDQINLLIFDEAHHTKKGHPYARIVRDHYMRVKTDRPRILGMTASPVDSRTGDLKVAALELEATLCSRIATISDEALAKENEKKQQIERVVYYAPLLQPEEAGTDLWQTLSEAFGLITEFSNHLEATQDVCTILGPWCADQYWNVLFSACNTSQKSAHMYHVEQLGEEAVEDLLRDESNQQLHQGLKADHVVTAVAKARRSMMEHMDQRHNAKIDARDFSGKFLALHDILRDAFSNGETRRCIVFVQKRYIAFLLSNVFLEPGVRIQNMLCGYVVGSQNLSSSIANMSVRDQFRTLQRFQKGEINCLFATQVAEEGIDIPECDLIIRFDLYDSAIQYIQSRGRARQVKSMYINMVEQDNIKQIRRLKEASRDANALRRFVSVLSADRKVADLDQPVDDLEREGKPQRVFRIPETGAQLTFDSSQQVLARFVSSLSSGADAHPEYVVTPTCTGGRFVATVILPDSSPVKTFRGMPQRSKILARGSAALEACIDMIDRKYINGHLQPTLSKRLPAMRNARLAISSNKRSEYDMRIKSDRWSHTGIPTDLFATIIRIDGSILAGKHGRHICLLTRFMLPQLAPIELYVDHTRKTNAVLVPCSTPMKVSEDESELLSKFTKTIFRDVFSKEYDCMAHALPYFIAPCASDSDSTTIEVDTRAVIDWPLLAIASVAEVDATLTASRAEDFQDKFLIDPWDGSRKFVTRTVAKGLGPFDPVPAGVPIPKSRGYLRVEQNIAEYSNSLSLPARRRMKWNPEQPVFHADLLPIRRNFLCPPCDENEKCRECFVILEPLVVSQLPGDVVMTALALPVIMYRIDSVSISVDACRLLDLDIDPRLALEAFTKHSSNTEEHGQQQVDFQSGMGNNYERLEFLGDAFLKMATTISLFTRIPKTTEFEYHVERMLLICNQNLFNHAVDRKLQGYIRSKAFDRRTWYPDVKLKKGKAPKTKVVHSLADKSIADVCEAVIGAAYMSEPEGTMDLAVKAVTKMVRSKNHAMTRFDDYYKEYDVPEWQSAAASATERFAAEKVHKRIGYRFNHPKLLRSAFKHPSYPYEPDIPHYQRLEFLGDALLDLAAVDYLYRKFPTADPQWLTEHKMAMVSNHFFACLCVELGLHRHLLTTGSSMIGKNAHFAEQLEQAKAGSWRAGSDGQPSLDFWVSLTQPPKALSDVLEAVVGAMFVDAKYDYQVVHDFFTRFISPYFADMALYDTYAAGHPVTVLTKLMQDVFSCHSWRLCVSTVPRGSEAGSSALTEENVVCAMMVHGKVVGSQIRTNGRDAKVDVATRVVRQVQHMSKETFRAAMGCECL